MTLKLIPPRPNKVQMYYPFAELESARREACREQYRDSIRHRAAAATCGLILAAVVIAAVLYSR